MASPTAVTFATMAVASLALINVRSLFNHAASPRDAKEQPILSRVGGRACFTAKDASPSRSKGRTGNGHPSNRLGVALSRTEKAANSQSLLSRNSLFPG